MHKNGKDRARGSDGILADKQTDTCTHIHTDVLITILRIRSRERSDNINHDHKKSRIHE